MTPLTQADILAGLRALSLRAGSHVLVHSSLSSFGYVEGGADAVIDALIEAVGPEGTVIVPTLTGSEALAPANPPIFDVRQTACWTGRIPETLRARPDAVRSLHPTHSVAAIGAGASFFTQDHVRSVTPCDEESPYGKLAAHPDGYVLLIGVTHISSTIFHHIEEVVGVDYHIQPHLTAATIVDAQGAAHPKHLLLHQYGTPRDFDVVESVLRELGIQRDGLIGAAALRLVKASAMVQAVSRLLRVSPRLLVRA
jgi:aminoglycoside 3-N-acetyltransferase